MNSEYEEIYVWIWLPGETEPVVAGRLTTAGPAYVFNYGKSYLQRDNAMAIYGAELPLLMITPMEPLRDQLMEPVKDQLNGAMA